MAKFKSNSICEALAYNLTKEELTKLGYDGYEAFDSLQCRDGYRLLSQPTINLLSDEKYTTENIYAKNFGEHILAVSDINTKLEMYRQEEKDNYSNLITNRMVGCEFPFSFNSSQQGFASIPLTASNSSSYTFLYNGAVVPVMVKSDTSRPLNIPYNHFEWFIGSENNIADKSINNAVNNAVKKLMDTITAINANFSLQDIRITPQNFIMTRTEFITNYEQLHNLITDDSIGIIVDDSVDKTAFQTALTTWDELDDTQKTIDKFFTDIQNKYKYWIYFKCSPLILVCPTATYLDIDKRINKGLDYPTTSGYLDVAKIDFTKTYNNRLGQARFHPRFLTKLLYSQVVQIPMNGTPPVIETYTEDTITIDKQILLDNEVANLTITLGKSTINNVDYPNKMGDVISDEPNKLVVTKVNDTSYTLSFSQDAVSEEKIRILVRTQKTTDGLAYVNNHYSYYFLCAKGMVKDDNSGAINVVGGSSGGGGGNGSTGNGPSGQGPGPERTPPRVPQDIDDETIKSNFITYHYNNSGVKGKAPTSVASIFIEPDYDFPGYKKVIYNYNAYKNWSIENTLLKGVGRIGNIKSKKHLFVTYNYLTKQIDIIEFDTELKQDTSEIQFEDYAYQEGDELKYMFFDLAETLVDTAIDNRTPKYVKRRHYLSIDASPALPTKQGDNITLIDLKQLGDIVDEEESSTKRNIYLKIGTEKVLLGHYNPTLEKKVFETNYLPIQWLADEIPHINAEGINDEVKGMFFIPGNNWLNDPTDVTAPCWVQNPGIFGSLDGLVNIAGTTYKVSSLEEGYDTLTDRTDKKYILFSDDIPAINFTKSPPEIIGNTQYDYVQDSNIMKCSVPLSKYKSKTSLVNLSLDYLTTIMYLDLGTETSFNSAVRVGVVIHNPKNDNFNLEADEFNRNIPPSVKEFEKEVGGNGRIKEATYLYSLSRSKVVFLSTRLPFQARYSIANDINNNNPYIFNVKEV